MNAILAAENPAASLFPRCCVPCFPELAFREEGVKVTLALSRKSVEFFKEEGAKQHTQYQRLIRRLIDAYVDAQATPKD